jgi:hypothetical protein
MIESTKRIITKVMCKAVGCIPIVVTGLMPRFCKHGDKTENSTQIAVSTE